MPSKLDKMKEEYLILTAKRDRINASLVTIKQRLDKANRDAIAAQEVARGIAKELDDARGGARAWLDLKRRIAELALQGAAVPVPEVEQPVEPETNSKKAKTAISRLFRLNKN